MEENRNSNKSPLAVAGLVLGIAALVTSFFPIVNFVSILIGTLAVILGIVCLILRVSKGKAILSLICGLLAVVIALSVLFFVFYAIGEGIEAGFDDIGNGITDVLDRFMSTMEKSGAPAEETIAVFTE